MQMKPVVVSTRWNVFGGANPVHRGHWGRLVLCNSFAAVGKAFRLAGAG